MQSKIKWVNTETIFNVVIAIGLLILFLAIFLVLCLSICFSTFYQFNYHAGIIQKNIQRNIVSTCNKIKIKSLQKQVFLITSYIMQYFRYYFYFKTKNCLYSRLVKYTMFLSRWWSGKSKTSLLSSWAITPVELRNKHSRSLQKKNILCKYTQYNIFKKQLNYGFMFYMAKHKILN